MLPKNIVVLYIIMLCMNKDIILFHLMVWFLQDTHSRGNKWKKWWIQVARSELFWYTSVLLLFIIAS